MLKGKINLKKPQALKGMLVFLMLLFGTVFLFSANQLYWMTRDYFSAGSLYTSLAAQYIKGGRAALERNDTLLMQGEVQEEYVSPIDFDGLRAINPDVVAWVYIPGTDIDYPVVHTDNNEKYLNTTFDGKGNRCGAIFMDYLNAGNLSDRNIIFYGHHMRNGSMFAQLTRFKQEPFFWENREVWVFTPQRSYRLMIIATYPQRADIRIRQTRFDTEDEFQEYLKWVCDNSYFDVPFDPSDVEQLFTLGTCSYEWGNTRTWVHAVYLKETGQALLP